MNELTYIVFGVILGIYFMYRMGFLIETSQMTTKIKENLKKDKEETKE